MDARIPADENRHGASIAAHTQLYLHGPRAALPCGRRRAGATADQ
jgi:hypothetical protein